MRTVTRSPLALLTTAGLLAAAMLAATLGAGAAAAGQGGGDTASDTGSKDGRIDFARDVQPILAKRCSPCHFEGGKMHEKAPFDQPETLVRLERPILRRIKAEDEQAVLRAFLDQRD